jgi:hypothetical protein
VKVKAKVDIPDEISRSFLSLFGETAGFYSTYQFVDGFSKKQTELTDDNMNKWFIFSGLC